METTAAVLKLTLHTWSLQSLRGIERFKRIYNISCTTEHYLLFLDTNHLLEEIKKRHLYKHYIQMEKIYSELNFDLF